jgi:hypothetical protein
VRTDTGEPAANNNPPSCERGAVGSGGDGEDVFYGALPLDLSVAHRTVYAALTPKSCGRRGSVTRVILFAPCDNKSATPLFIDYIYHKESGTRRLRQPRIARAHPAHATSHSTILSVSCRSECACVKAEEERAQPRLSASSRRGYLGLGRWRPAAHPHERFGRRPCSRTRAATARVRMPSCARSPVAGRRGRIAGRRGWVAGRRGWVVWCVVAEGGNTWEEGARS